MSTEALNGTEPIETEQHEAPASLAEFREDFPSAPKPGQPPQEPVAERTPRRAKSHQATAKDVPEIAALTKQLREAEEAVKVERKDGESDRVYELRKRTEIAKRAAAPAPAAKVEPAVERTAPVARPATQPSAFTEKEPTIDQFSSSPDPWLALSRAVSAYDRRKEAFDASQETAKTTYQAEAQKFNTEINAGIQAHGERVRAFTTAKPEIKALFDAEMAKPPQDQIQLTLPMRGAIEFHEQGPEMIAALLKDPVFADEIIALTWGHAVGDPRTDQFVATVRRRLLQRISGVASGSPTPSRPIKIAPRPPNPERTVPQTPRDSSPSEVAGSLAEHRQKFPVRH